MNKNIGLFSLLLLSLLGSYYFILDNHFLGDDINRLVHTMELNSLYMALTGSLADRPLLQTIMWLEKTLFGLDPFLFRVFNLFFHAIAGFQLYRLITEVYELRGGVLTKNAENWAWVAVFLFALHPLHSQSLYIVIQGGVILAGLFGIWSLRFFYKWLFLDTKNSLIFCFITLFLAMLCKPIVSFLPIFYLFSFIVYRKSEDLRSWRLLLPNFLILLVPVAYFFVLKVNTQPNSHGALSYFLIQMEVLFTYFRLILLPLNLKYLYDFNPPASLLFNLNWLYLGLHLGFLICAWKLINDKFYKILVFGFYFSFLPESSFFPIEHVAFEHRTFFSMLFFFFTLSLLGLEKRIWEKKIARPLAGLFLSSYIVFIQARNFQIKPETTWFLHSLENSVNYDDFNIPGVMYLLEKKKYEEAESILQLYKTSGKNSADYKMLYEIAGYYRNSDSKYLDNVASILSLPDIGFKPRLLGNNFLISKLALNSKDTPSLLKMEDMLFHQIEVLEENKDIFKGPLNFYYIIASKLAATVTEPKGRILRIKATLQKYFKKNDEDVLTQIRAALVIDPQSKDLNDAEKLLIFLDKR